MDKILKKAISDKEEEIRELQEENPYHITEELTEKGFTEGTSEIYAQYPHNPNYCLKLGRKDEKNFSYVWVRQTEEGTFKSVSTIISRAKSIIEDDEARNKKLIQYGERKGIDSDKEHIEDFLDNVAIEIEQYEGLEILKNKNAYVEVGDQVESDETTTDDKPRTFEDYPAHIQKLAREVLAEGDLLKRTANTIAYRLGSNETEAKLTNYAIMGLFGGGGVNTLANAKTGTGKSKLIAEVIKNYPDTYHYDFNNSSKRTYRDGEDLQGHKIIIANDVSMNDSNIGLLKAFTRKEDKIIYKTLEGDKNGKQKKIDLELDGDYVVLVTFAKNTPDEEFANPFFNLNIAPNEHDKEEIGGKIKTNNTTNALTHKGYKLANEVNKCAIQYIIDKNYTVFNPYGLLLDTKRLNNRDINNVLDFVKGTTLFKYDDRNTVTIKGKQYVISSHEDLEEITKIWEQREEVQKYKLDSIQEEILKLLPVLSDEEAEAESNNYNDWDNNDKSKKFFGYHMNARRKQIEYDIANGTTKALPISYIREKTGRGKTSINRAMYYEDKYNNKPTLEGLGLIGYYGTDIGSKYPQRMYYRKSKSSNSSESIVPMFQNQFGTGDDELNQKISIITSLLYCSNILINMYIGDKILSYCHNYTADISSYDKMCEFITGFIAQYDDELQEFDYEHISLAELDYHNTFLQKKFTSNSKGEILEQYPKTDDNAQNGNHGTVACSNSEKEQRNNTKSEIGAISEKGSKSKSDKNALNSNQDKVDCSNSGKEQKNHTKSKIERILQENVISVDVGYKIIDVIDNNKLTINEIEQKISHKYFDNNLEQSMKEKIKHQLHKLVEADLIRESFTSGAVYSQSTKLLMELCIIEEGESIEKVKTTSSSDMFDELWAEAPDFEPDEVDEND